MDSAGEGPPDEPSGGAHAPFTLSERLQQLTEIDKDITTLLSLTNDTLRPLAPAAAAAAAAGGSQPAPVDTEAQVAAFKEAMDGFLTTLHAVDVRLKRQIWGLEEAGIISLKEPRAAGVSLAPNGVGDIGSLDVGWLNSRSNKVDRDMEAELWAKMRAGLARLEPEHAEHAEHEDGAAGAAGAAGSGGMDVDGDVET